MEARFPREGDVSAYSDKPVSIRFVKAVFNALLVRAPLRHRISLVVHERPIRGGLAYCDAKFDDDGKPLFEFHIALRVRDQHIRRVRCMTHLELQESIVHEWAHARANGARVSHGSEWGVEYAKCYRATSEGKRAALSRRPRARKERTSQVRKRNERERRMASELRYLASVLASEDGYSITLNGRDGWLKNIRAALRSSPKRKPRAKGGRK